MNEPVSIGGNWKALEVKNAGCIVQGDKGLIFLPGVSIEEGELIAHPMPAASEVSYAPIAQQVVRRGPSSQAEVNVKGFLDTMKQKNLTAGGEYVGYGPYLNKLKELLIGLEEDSPLIAPLGTFIATGDHPRFSFAASVMALDDAKLNELSQILSDPKVDVLEAFVEKCLTGAA